MVATAIKSVTMVLWKETAFPVWRAMEMRWKRNIVSRVSSVIVVIRHYYYNYLVSYVGRIVAGEDYRNVLCCRRFVGRSISSGNARSPAVVGAATVAPHATFVVISASIR